jgi:hypothetical protein
LGRKETEEEGAQEERKEYLIGKEEGLLGKEEGLRRQNKG